MEEYFEFGFIDVGEFVFDIASHGDEDGEETVLCRRTRPAKLNTHNVLKSTHTIVLLLCYLMKMTGLTMNNRERFNGNKWPLVALYVHDIAYTHYYTIIPSILYYSIVYSIVEYIAEVRWW